MRLYKKLVCFVLVFSYPIYMMLIKLAATVQDYKDRGITVPPYIRVIRLCVWLFVLWFLFLYIKYCFGYYRQCKIRYSPGWSAKVEKMGRCVCLAPELPYIDCSHQSWTETDHHVTNELANQTIETTPVTVSHSQVPDKDESNPQHIPKTPFKPPSRSSSCQSWTETDHHVTSEPANQTIKTTPETVSHFQVPDKIESNPQHIPKTPFKPPSTSSSCQSCTESDRHVTSEPANQTLETTPATVSHSQMPNRDESNLPYIPKSPFKPLSMNRKGLGRVHGMMNLALATRQRRDFVGPRSPLVPLRLKDPPNLSRYGSVMGLALAQRQRRAFIGPRDPLTPILLTGPPVSFARCHSVMDLALAQRKRRCLIGPRPLLTPFLLTDADIC